MKKVYFSLGLLAFAFSHAQQYEEVSTIPFKNFFYSSSAVADFNNDGYKDVFFTGAIDSDEDTNVDTTFNEYYQNNNGAFAIQQSLDTNVVHLSDVKALDFDNDGLLDLVTTGLSYDNIVDYQQYRFKNTGAGFELLENIPGKIYGGLDTFDFNHDGKVDYALNGTQYTPEGFTHYIDLYLNTGSNFELTENWIPGTQNGDFKIIDLNNDNQLDAVVFGFNADYDATFNVYTNVDGTLQLSQELTPVSNGKMAFADFNADGFQDFVVSGSDADGEAYLATYINDGNGNFTENKIDGEGLDSANVQTADLNNDGYYDFIINGDDENYDAHVKIFINQPADHTFVKAENTNIYNLGSGGSLQVFDYDNDHKLDVLVNGFDWADPDYLPYTKLFKNISDSENTKPNPPLNLSAALQNDEIIFNWSGAVDDNTPENALQYEITIGSQSGKSDIAKYKVTTKNWYLKNVDLPENIFWSVKSIDAGNEYSIASEEKLIATLSTRDSAVTLLSVYPNPVENTLYIKTNDNVVSATIFTISGEKVASRKLGNKSLDFATFPKGIYIVKIQLENGKVITKKVIKK